MSGFIGEYGVRDGWREMVFAIVNELAGFYNIYYLCRSVLQAI